MSEFLDQYVFHTETIEEARLSFAQKMHLCKACCIRNNRFGEWTLTSATNTLRNDLAHRLISPEQKKKLTKVKEIYFLKDAGFYRIEDVTKETDVVIIFNAYAHFARLLTTFLTDSKCFRTMIYAMDRSINPNQPAFKI